MLFANRREAGRRLAAALRHWASENPVVVGLPRGGVPVAFEVARELAAPLDVIVVRKLGAPFQPELALGAVGEDGAVVINRDVLLRAGLRDDELAELERTERAEVERRARLFREARERVPLAGRTVIVVDDGIATGSTAQAACHVARAQGAARVVLAVPVAPVGIEQRMTPAADEVVCLSTPHHFVAVGQFYADFWQTSDDEVIDLLGRAASAVTHDEDVVIPVGDLRLSGRLTVPPASHGVILFAHGSGSSRHSPRNRFVAQQLNASGFATLLFDLLTAAEERNRHNVFDIDLLGRRLVEATSWVRAEPMLRDLRLGYFGASTGAGAALWAASDPSVQVAAVVSRGGRPDLAFDRLALVRAPTLLVVGGADDVVLELNRQAADRLVCEHRVEVVPGATHLFEEPGALDDVARLAAHWFGQYLR